MLLLNLKMLVHIPNEGKRSKRYGAELKRQGIKEGDIVKISNYELEWYE